MIRIAVVAALCAVLIAGCGAPSILPTPTREAVTLRFGVRSNVADYAPLAAQFNKLHPNISVQITNLGQLQVIGGGLDMAKLQGLDAFRDTVPYPPDPKIKDWLLPLNERIDAYKGFPRSDMFPGIMEAMQSQGIQFGLPAGVNPFVAYYDNSRFKLAKATPPTSAWTMADFLQAALAVNSQEGVDAASPAFGYGYCTDSQGADPLVITYLMGGQLVDNLLSPTRPTLDSPANQRALQWYSNLRLEYRVTPDPDQLKQLFRQRGVYDAVARAKCGLWLGFYSDMGGRTTGSKWTGEPVMLPLPRGQAAFNAASVDGYYILRQSKRQDEAWQWLLFLLERQEASGVLAPPRRSIVESAAFGGRVSADVLAVARGLPSTTLILGATTGQGVDSVLTIYLAAVDQVVRGQSDVKTALSSAQTKALALFASSH